MILREGLPFRGEVVMCTVKNIGSHSAFVSLDEYLTLDAMLHISEIAPGRIKNIRNHIQKGKQIVCTVMRVERRKGFVDVSLKRVTDSERRKKFAEYRLSRRFESMLSFISKTNKNFNGEDVEKEILKDYPSLGRFMRNVQRKGIELVENLDIQEKWKKMLIQEISKILEKKEINIKKTIKIVCNDPDGVEKIKDFFVEMSTKHPIVDAKYGGAPNYFLSITTNDYKMADKEFEEFFSDAETFCKKNKINIEALK